MSLETITIAVILIAIFTIAYAIASYASARKGKLAMTLARKRVGSGQPLEGSTSLECKKPVEGRRLLVTLVCVEKAVSGRFSRPINWSGCRLTVMVDYYLGYSNARRGVEETLLVVN